MNRVDFWILFGAAQSEDVEEVCAMALTYLARVSRMTPSCLQLRVDSGDESASAEMARLTQRRSNRAERRRRARVVIGDECVFAQSKM